MAYFDETVGMDVQPSVSPQALTDGTVNGAEVDLSGVGAVTVAVVTGTITDGTHTVSLEETNTSGSGYTAVAAADLIGSAPAVVAANDDTTFEFGYKGSKRYLRAKVVTTGSTTGGLLAVAILRLRKRKQP